MYEQFYGFHAKPFQLSPDPAFYFGSSGHARALAYLEYGVQQAEGFVVVTGEVGTGKTTLARMLHESVSQSRDVVVSQMVMTQGGENDLLAMIAEAFGLEQEGKSRTTHLKGIERFLRTQHAAGKRVLLIIDEVQNLPTDALETLRMLSNFSANEKSLFQSLLLGQAEFRKTLSDPGLVQLRQRVIASCHLLPLRSVAETQGYIEHRMRHAGWHDSVLFSEDAYASVHGFTHGVPRRINTFCDRLLLYAYLEGLHQIGAETVDAVAEEVTSDFPGVPMKKNGANGGGIVLDADQSRVGDLERRVHMIEAALQGTQNVIHRTLRRRFQTR